MYIRCVLSVVPGILFLFQQAGRGGGRGVPSFVVLYAITDVILFSYYSDPLFCKLCNDGIHVYLTYWFINVHVFINCSIVV